MTTDVYDGDFPNFANGARSGTLRRGMGGGGRMDWINLAQVTDSWRALVSVVMNLRVP